MRNILSVLLNLFNEKGLATAAFCTAAGGEQE